MKRIGPMNTYRYVRAAVPTLGLVILLLFNSGECISQSTYDQAKVGAALQQWRKKAATFDTAKPTLLFTTSIMGCAGCCASAINHMIGVAGAAGIDANILVVVATPIPREGLAMRKLFKTRNVAEDADNVLSSVFHTNGLLPDLYVLDAGDRVLHRHQDLQHNYLEDSTLRRYLPIPERNRGDTVSLHSFIQLQEDDDHIIGDIRSVHMDTGSRTLEFLETRQNAIYRFGVDSGQLMAVYPVDSSIAWHFKKPGDRDDWWADLAEAYQPLVKYDGIIHRGNDTSYVLAELFTHYTATIDSTGEKPRTNIRWEKGLCVLKVADGRALSVDTVETSPWYPYGEAIALGNDILSAGLWGGSLMEYVDPQHANDSLYTFVLISNGDYRIKPIVRTTELQALSGRTFNRRYRGLMCSSSNGELFYISKGNGIFLRGWRSSDSLEYSLITMAGVLARDSGVSVMDMATNDAQVHTLLLDTDTPDTQPGLYVQAYDMAGRFLGEKIIRTDADDPLLAARIIGYDGTDAYVLMKQRTARWSIARLSLSELPS